MESSGGGLPVFGFTVDKTVVPSAAKNSICTKLLPPRLFAPAFIIVPLSLIRPLSVTFNGSPATIANLDLKGGLLVAGAIRGSPALINNFSACFVSLSIALSAKKNWDSSSMTELSPIPIPPGLF